MKTIAQTVRISIEDPHSECGLLILGHASEELNRRYPEETTRDLVPEGVDQKDGVFLMAWMSDTPAGCGSIRRMTREVAEIKRMFVADFARRQGIGRCILEALEKVAIDRRYRVIRLETGIRQPEALRLYESTGYRRNECYAEYIDNPFSVCFTKQLTNLV